MSYRKPRERWHKIDLQGVYLSMRKEIRYVVCPLPHCGKAVIRTEGIAPLIHKGGKP